MLIYPNISTYNYDKNKQMKKYKKIFSFFKYTIIFFELYSLKFFINTGNKSSPFSNNHLNSYKIYNTIKSTLKNKVYKIFKKNITCINSLYIDQKIRFGNYFISLNNAIIFCEFFSCKRIILKSNYIKNKIFYQKYNLTLESNYSSIYIDNNSMIININYFFYNFSFTDLGKVNRFYVFRKEVLNNLPKVKINFDDLYIYIRGGDIFKNINKSARFYFQPPLCFYEEILNQFIFRKITIISEDMSNPTIKKLLEEYPYIKNNKNDIKVDISYLSNSYNIVSATSSFIVSIIKLNQNIKFIWEYDFYKLSERYLHLHYSVYSFSFNYTIYQMNASENYKKIMYPFNNSNKQRKLLLEEKCDNNFHIILPRI